MVTVTLMKFESNLAVSIDWAKRQAFKKWSKVIVWKNDVLMLMRLGCTVVAKKELDVKQHKDIFIVTKEDIKKANDIFCSAMDNKSLEQLETLLWNFKVAENCDEKVCKEYVQDLYEVKFEQAKEVDEEAKKKEKAEKVALKKASNEKKKTADQLTADKKKARALAEKKAWKKSDQLKIKKEKENESIKLDDDDDDETTIPGEDQFDDCLEFIKKCENVDQLNELTYEHDELVQAILDRLDELEA